MPRKKPGKGAGPKETGIDPGFWRELRKAQRPLLVLDFDGTLAPLHRERMKVRIPQASRDALEKILGAERTRVVVITGRPATQAALLMPGLKIEIVGEHGWERMTPSGKIKRHPLDQDHKGSLDQARDLAKKRGMTLRIERKRSSIALHTRGMPPGQANLLECVVLAEWRRLCEDGRLACLRFNGGVELRSAAHTKGTAVRAIVQGQRKPDFVLYVGDDRTDEDAFEELKGVGHRMAVGPRVPEKMIEYRFTGPDQLGEFLAKWAKLEASLKKGAKKGGRS